jgi:MFS superfamily sulfate permease-like transporter
MLATNQSNLRTELQGGIESTLMGFSTSIGPILLFVGILGSQSLAAALWATLVTAVVVPAVGLLLKGHAALLPSTRAASLTAYIGLVLQLGIATGGPGNAGLALSAQQLLLGLAAGSLLFAAASALILLAGLLKLGVVFKMIPSTVTSGVASGTALLLVWLATKQMLHGTWAVALTTSVMVICFFIWPKVQRRFSRLRLMPAILVAMLAGLVLGMNMEPVMQAPTTPVSYDLSWIALRLWPALLDQQFGHLLIVGLPGTVTLALVMILETFTANSVMETRFGLRIDANRELVVLGGSNLVSAMMGGVPCTGSPPRSVASWMAGGRGAKAALTCLLLTGALMLVFGSWLLVLPAGVVAGLFLLQATVIVDMTFMKRLAEMVKTRQLHREGSADLGFWMTLVISLVGFFGNLIWACFLGVGLSALAVLRSVSSSLTAQWAYLDRYRSRRVRSAGETANLARLFHRVGVLRLTGHLFFGNSTRLTQLVDELHLESVAVVVDVSQVHDVDPSGVGALNWLVRALVERKLTVVLTGLRRTSSAELRRALQDLQGVEYRIDLDIGLEACEEVVLQNATLQAISLQSIPLENNQLLQNLSQDEVTTVLMLGERREVAKGAALFYKADDADGVWLLEEGTVSILSGAYGEFSSARLATIGPGQFVGEMGYIDGKTRSATARADSPVRALLLDKAAIAALIEHQPSIALKITRNIARELSHRVRSTSALLTDETKDASSDWANSSLSTLSRF